MGREEEGREHHLLPTIAFELDDPIEELRRRAQASARDGERRSALLDAVLAISSDLELADVLKRVVRAACELVDAKYGALGVLGRDHEHLIEFVTCGVTDEQRAAMGTEPSGRGVLGLLIHHPSPLRIPELADHPESFGFPANHPPMHTFLGAPVQVRGKAFGNLYLTEKHGGAQFTAQDETALVGLAAAAGVAIENARLYELARSEQRWLETTGELRQMLFEGARERVAMDFLAERARSLAGASRAVVGLYDVSRVLSVNGFDCVGEVGHPGGATLESPGWDDLIAMGAPLVVGPESVHGELLLAREIGELDARNVAVTTAAVPIKVGSEGLGVLVVAWDTDEEYVGDAVLSLGRLAVQTGLALLAARTRSDRGRLALLEDRDRIARDMHDHVIQRLFATGLSLQSTTRLRLEPAVQARLEEAVGELDEAIKDIRQSIFELQRTDPGSSIVDEVTALVRDASEGLLEPARLEVTGDLQAVPTGVIPDLTAVLREGLSNVARHARARTTDVRIQCRADGLTVTIVDDGRGLPVRVRKSGLANLKRRAARHGGHLTLSSTQDGGTTVTWSVPLQRVIDQNRGTEVPGGGPTDDVR